MSRDPVELLRALGVALREESTARAAYEQAFGAIRAKYPVGVSPDFAMVRALGPLIDTLNAKTITVKHLQAEVEKLALEMT